jgi:hypothetical protein
MCLALVLYENTVSVTPTPLLDGTDDSYHVYTAMWRKIISRGRVVLLYTRGVDVGYPMSLPTWFTSKVEQTKIQAQALPTSAMMMFVLPLRDK